MSGVLEYLKCTLTLLPQLMADVPRLGTRMLFLHDLECQQQASSFDIIYGNGTSSAIPSRHSTPPPRRRDHVFQGRRLLQRGDTIPDLEPTVRMF